MNTILILNILNGTGISEETFKVIFILGFVSIMSSIIAIKNELFGKNTFWKKAILMTPVAMITLSVMFWITIAFLISEAIFPEKSSIHG